MVLRATKLVIFAGALLALAACGGRQDEGIVRHNNDSFKNPNAHPISSQNQSGFRRSPIKALVAGAGLSTPSS
jgi:hypothetical protein